MSFPAVAKQVVGVSGDTDGFIPPIAEAVESTDAETAKAGCVGAFGSFETPIEIAFGSGGVHVGVNRAIVSFLVDDETFSAGCDDGTIFGSFHRPNFQRDAWDLAMESAYAIGHVVGGDKFRMFARDQEDIAEALGEQFAALVKDFIDGERDAQDRIIAREAAVFAIVNAFVGEVERSKQTNDFAEALLCELP